MAFISRITIDEINNRMDAIVIANDYVRMEQRGGRWWGLCPFHNEKTPSFTVNPDLKSYYCFGCHKGGSILNFVMEMDKLSFPEAVEHLAKRIGVEIQYENGSNASGNNENSHRKDELLELYKRMSGTFHHLFKKNPENDAAKRYIIERGIDELMIDKFRLGYAPADRQWMHKFLLQKGYSAEFLSKSGLFSTRHPGLPLFYGRIMFPINDRQGRVVAFGGRIINDNQGDSKSPKYINSPEMDFYKKGETLFAIDLALPEIRKTKTVYLAEGYMDVIALHQAGVVNSVASLGTAFTDEQAKLLRRWADNVILVFDLDEAGHRAAVKGILTCRKNGLSCAVAVPPDGDNEKDPADVLKHSGAQVLHKRMKSYINDFDYLLTRVKSQFNIHESGGKSAAAAFLFPYFKVLESEVSRDTCMETAAAAIGTAKTALMNDWRQYNAGKPEKQGEESQNQVLKQLPIRMNEELYMLMTVAVNDFSGSSRFYPEFRKNLNIRDIDDPAAKELFIALEESFINNDRDLDSFLTRISSPELRKFYLEKGASGEFAINPARILSDGIRKAVRKKLERQKNDILLRLKLIKMNSVTGPEADKLCADIILIDEKLLKLKEDCQ